MERRHDFLVTLRLPVAEHERLRRLANEIGRPLSVMLRLALHRLRRENLPRGWLRDAEIERAVGRPR